ncbi:MAG: MMPL family transporter [Betaproteobacteria bacterium]|nr:MMPL family transporter [Betaproteobacteria bacterium]
MEVSSSRSYRFFARWAAFSYQNAVWVILLALIIAAMSVIYTARNLGVHTDTTDMLSEDVPFRVNHERYKVVFPQYKDTLLLAVDAPTPEQAHDVAKRLANNLREDATHFYDAYYLSGEDFFEQNGLLYKSVPELEEITDRLAAAQPLVARIANDPALFTFATVLTEAIDELRDGRDLDLAPIVEAVSATLDAQLAGEPRALSWQVLLGGEKQKDNYQELVLVRPKLDYSELFAAEQSIAALRDVAQETGLTDDALEKMRVTGAVALAYDELNSAMHGAQDAGLLALVMVTVVLFMALRTPGAVLTVLLSLILGLVLTAGFATVAVGHLNLISIAFAVLYIGLGVDYAIHFLLRHQEVRQSKRSVSDTLYSTGGDMGRALMVCAVTTAIGFYAFMPTAYRGVAELGLISGTGMIISLLVTLTLVPALQRFFPTRIRKSTISVQSINKVLDLPRRSRKLVYIVTAILIAVSVIALPQVKFDYNLLNLNNPQAESVQTFRELLAEAEDSPWHIIALADDYHETEQLVQQLSKLPEVDKVLSILDLIPAAQTEKSQLIGDMALTLGPISFATESQSQEIYSVSQQQRKLKELLQSLEQLIAEQPDHVAIISLRALSLSLANLLTQINESSDSVYAEQLLRAVDHDLLSLLPGSIGRLQAALEASPFTQQALPKSLSSHWQSHDDVYRLAIYPTENINDNDALRRFVRAVQQVTPFATGAPVISLEAGEAVVDAFVHAFSLALLGVTLALLVLLRNVFSTVLVLVPLLLAALFTGAGTVYLGVPFNFANIIALPLLLGIGIDCSVHMVHRSRNTGVVYENLLHTSTARAIFYSALTTLVGFGSLAFSPHQGTASMGLLLAVGVFLTLVCVLIILPVLLQSSSKKTNSNS